MWAAQRGWDMTFLNRLRHEKREGKKHHICEQAAWDLGEERLFGKSVEVQLPGRHRV